MTENQTINSIRLSMLNPDVRKKLEKFDTLNDGSLSIEEALQGLVTLQKQSNNYKRTVYLLIPLMLLTLVGVLGINILSINLTKDMKVSSNTKLTNNNGDVVQTKILQEQSTLFSVLTSSDLETLYSMTSLQIDGLFIPVQGIYVKGIDNETTTVMISTPQVYFSIDSQGDFTVDFNTINDITNEFSQIVYHVLSTNLQSMKISMMMIDEKISIKNADQQLRVILRNEDRKPQTRGLGGFGGCRRTTCFG
jgi:hypothetical protein